MTKLSSSSSVPQPRGSLRHHRWFHNQFPLFSLFSSALWDLVNSMPVCSLMLSSHLFLCLPCLFPLSLCLARWFWSDVMNGRCVHTTAVCVWSNWLLDLGTDCTVQSSDYAADVVVSKLVQMGVNFFIRLFSCCQYVFSLSSERDLFSVPQWYFETLFRSWCVLTV